MSNCILFIVVTLFLNFTPLYSQTMDSVSYSLGVLIAQNLKSQGFVGLNNLQLAQGIQDVLENKSLKITVQDAGNLVNQYLSAQASKGHEGNLAAGETFLLENKKRAGVKTTSSGLQSEVILEGTGPSPKLTDKVKVHYHGTLIDGTVFDSSVQRGEPISFPLGNVIQGWQEGLQLMKTGSKYKLFIPYHLAYGERSAGAAIKPFSALIFEVELLGIE